MKKTRRKSKVLLGVGLILLFTFIPISSLVAQRCVQPPEGLVSWWDADAVSGTTASDIQDGNDGTLMNGATTAPGKVGDAFSFDGLDDYVEIPDSTLLQFTPSTPFSIDGWFSVDAFDEQESESILAKWGSAYGQFGYGLVVNRDRKLQFSLDPYGVANRKNAIGTTTIAEDTWYHFSATYDENTKLMKLYLNGVLEASTVSTVVGTVSDTPLYIGKTVFEYGEFTGLIDEVEIFNRVLSASEIQAIYNADTAGKCKGEDLQVTIDIKPQSCPNPLNVKSKGVLPVAILGTEDFDITDIDLASIRLAGVAPIRSSIEDVSTPLLEKEYECDCITEGEDGIDDLTLKFNTQEIVGVLGEVADGDELVLTLTGELYDGTLIEGEDCIIIISKGGGKSK